MECALFPESNSTEFDVQFFDNVDFGLLGKQLHYVY